MAPGRRRRWPFNLTTTLLVIALIWVSLFAVREHILKERVLEELRSSHRMPSGSALPTNLPPNPAPSDGP